MTQIPSKSPLISDSDACNKNNLYFTEGKYLPEVIEAPIFYNCGTQTLGLSKNVSSIFLKIWIILLRAIMQEFFRRLD